MRILLFLCGDYSRFIRRKHLGRQSGFCHAGFMADIVKLLCSYSSKSRCFSVESLFLHLNVDGK